MSYLVLARKWRPQTFDDLTGQEHVGRILKNALTLDKTAHAYIFSGPRGVGKTSTARILARALNCTRRTGAEPCNACPSCEEILTGSSIDVSEIDGASNTGVDNVRELRERIRYAPSSGKYKVYIIDEAHMLSTAAFNALLKTLEEPPAHVIFVLATTDPRKIPPTVLSRCQHLPFRRISRLRISARLRQIVRAEDMKIADSAVDMVARAGDGSMRDSLTILDQVASFADEITADDVRALLSLSDVNVLGSLAEAIIGGKSGEIIRSISDLTDAGNDIRSLSKDFLQFMRDLLIYKVTGGAENVLEIGEEETLLLNRLSVSASAEHLTLLVSELVKTEMAIRASRHPRIVFEMTLLRLSMLHRFMTISDALGILEGSSPKPVITAGKALPPAEKKPSGRHKESPKPAEIPAAQEKTPSREPLPDIWQAAVCRIEETNKPLSCHLGICTPSFTGGQVTLSFDGAQSFHADSVTENLATVKTALREVAGKDIKVTVQSAGASRSTSKKDLMARAMKEPIVRDALDLFEARVTNIQEPVGTEGGNNVEKDAR